MGGLRSGEITLDAIEKAAADKRAKAAASSSEDAGQMDTEQPESKSDTVSGNELESQAEKNITGRLKEWATQDVYSPETIKLTSIKLDLNVQKVSETDATSGGGEGAETSGNNLGGPEIAVQSSGFDEDFYRATYADVDKAVESGQFKSGQDHFNRHGQYEQRSQRFAGNSFEFDEVFHLQTYTDVAKAVAEGAFRSGAHHFWRFGRSEGRMKSLQNQEALKVLNTSTPATQEDKFAQALQRGLNQSEATTGKLSKPQMFATVQQAASNAEQGLLSRGLSEAFSTEVSQVGIALPSLDDALAARKEQELALIDKEGFSGGGENHTIWMEKDSKGRPNFIMASDPKPLPEQLNHMRTLALDKFGMSDRERMAQIYTLLEKSEKLADSTAQGMEVQLEDGQATATEVNDAKTAVIVWVQKALDLLNGAEISTSENDESRLSERLPSWRARIRKVCDPVAFMTSGTERSSVGNYDKAIQNRNSSDGFYELAKNECLALQMEIISFSMMGLANMETQTSFEMLS